MKAGTDPERQPLWSMVPVLATQGLWVRRRTPRLGPATGPVSGSHGSGQAVNLLALGDSIVVGVGVKRTEHALPSRLAEALANHLQCMVNWEASGRNGASTSDLEARLHQEHPYETPDLVMISNGINDLTSLTTRAAFTARKKKLYEKLEQCFPGVLLCQLGLPPMGMFPALPQPLRRMLGRRSAEFDARLVELAGVFNYVEHYPFVQSPPTSMFAHDGYHPNEAGVAAWAADLAPSIALHMNKGHPI